MFINKQEACNAITNSCTGSVTLKLKNTTTLAIGVQLYTDTNIEFTQSGYLVKDTNVYTITNGIITLIETCNNPVCSVNFTTNTSQCDSSNNFHNLSGVITFVNAPSTGTLTISTSSKSQTFNPPFTNNQNYQLTGINSDGASHNVTATFSANNCTLTKAYTSPNSCIINQCSVSFTKNISSCDTTTNKYNVTGVISLTNAPTTGTLTISVGTISQIFNAPFNSALNYALNNLDSDGLNKTINVVLSASTCTSTQNYTAPISCIINNGQAIFIKQQDVLYNTNGTIKSTRSSLTLNNYILNDLAWNTQFVNDTNYTKTTYLGIRDHNNLTPLQNIDVSAMQGFDLAPITLYAKNTEKWINSYGCQSYIHIPTTLNRRVWNSNNDKVTTYVMPSSYVFNDDVRPQFVNSFPNFSVANGKIIAISVFPDTEISTWNSLNKGVTLVGSYDNRYPSIYPPINKIVTTDGDEWLKASGVPSNADDLAIANWATNVTQSTLDTNFNNLFYQVYKQRGLIMMDGEAIGGRPFDAAIQKMANVINYYRNLPDFNALVCFWGYSFWQETRNLLNTNRDWEFTGTIDTLLNTYGYDGTGLKASYGTIWANCFDVLFCTPNYIITPDQQQHIYEQIKTGLFNKKYFPDKKVIWSTWEMFEFSGNPNWQISYIEKLRNNGIPYRKYEFYKAFPSYSQSVGAWATFAMDGLYQWDSTTLITANPDYYGFPESKVFNVDGTPITVNSYGINNAVNPARDCKNTDWLMAGIWAVSQSNDIVEANTPLHFTEYSTDGGISWRSETNKQSYVWNCLNDSKPIVMHKLSTDGNTVLLLAYNGFNDPVLKQTIKVKINTKIFDIDLFGQYTNVSRINLT